MKTSAGGELSQIGNEGKMVDSNEGVVSRHYFDPSFLSERIDILRQKSSVDLVGWILDVLQLHGSEVVLDAGCGSGNFLIPFSQRIPKGRIDGIDLSKGMVRHLNDKVGHKRNVRVLEGDIEKLDRLVNEATYDIAMANFAMQHVKNIETGLQQLRRSLKVGGKLVCITGSRTSKHEIYDIHYRTLGEFWPDFEREPRAMTRFDLEGGWYYVVKVFKNIEIVEVADDLVFDDEDSLLKYYRNSISDKGMDGIPSEIQSAVVDKVQYSLACIVREQGGLVLSVKNGAFISRKHGSSREAPPL